MRTFCEQSVSRQLAKGSNRPPPARDLGHARLAADAMDPRTRRLPALSPGCSTTPRAPPT